MFLNFPHDFFKILYYLNNLREMLYINHCGSIYTQVSFTGEHIKKNYLLNYLAVLGLSPAYNIFDLPCVPVYVCVFVCVWVLSCAQNLGPHGV